MKHIASELGVSVALVSYVLNGKFTNRINVETANKIKKLAAKYKYTPNLIAKSLKNSQTFTIGLVVADISNLFYSEIAKFIEIEAHISGYNVIFASAYEDSNRFESIVNVFLSKQVDGLILAVPEGANQYLEYVEGSGVPYVVIDREFSTVDKLKTIGVDNYSASEEVVNHLVENGYRRLGAVALNTNLIHLQKRKAGFMNTAQHLVGEDNTFIYELAEKDLEAQIDNIIQKALFRDKVDALYFFTNRIAMAALAKLARYDIRIPDELAVVCFDEAHAYNIFRKELTYVKQPIQQMSKQAVQIILGNPSTNVSNIFNTELIINESSLRKE